MLSTRVSCKGELSDDEIAVSGIQLDNIDGDACAFDCCSSLKTVIVTPGSYAETRAKENLDSSVEIIYAD